MSINSKINFQFYWWNESESEVIQSCPTLCDPILDHQGPLSTGILQARILERIAMPSSRGSSQPRGRTQVSHIAGRFFTFWATREAQQQLYTATNIKNDFERKESSK